MKKFRPLVLSSLTLAWLTLQAIELEPEERDEIEEAGIELSEQLDEAQQNKEELSEELKHLNAEGELWEASNLELELHNVELRIELLEKLVSRHRDVLKAVKGDDIEFVEEKLDGFHRAWTETELRQELNELSMRSKRLRLEIKQLGEIEEYEEKRGLKQELSTVMETLQEREELIALWSKTVAVWETGDEETAERLEQEFWNKRETAESQREQAHLELELIRIEQQQAKLKSEAEWLETRKANLSRTITSHRKLADLRKQVLRAYNSGDEAHAQSLEETLEVLSERFNIENEMRHLQHELHFAEKEHGTEEEVAELREAIRELSEELKSLQD